MYDSALILNSRNPASGVPLRPSRAAMLPPALALGPIVASSLYGQHCYSMDILHADGAIQRQVWFRQGDGRRAKTQIGMDRQDLVSSLRQAGPVVVLHDEKSFDAIVAATRSKGPTPAPRRVQSISRRQQLAFPLSA